MEFFNQNEDAFVSCELVLYQNEDAFVSCELVLYQNEDAFISCELVLYQNEDAFVPCELVLYQNEDDFVPCELVSYQNEDAFIPCELVLYQNEDAFVPCGLVLYKNEFFRTVFKEEFGAQIRDFIMSTEELFEYVVSYFQRTMPQAETELHYSNPYELLVAVILSAQCTDKRVNMITPGFFRLFPTAELLSKATQEDVYELIKSCSYPNNKAKSLLGMAKMLTEKYHGEVPGDIEQLLEIPGVGRKTANVIASVIYNKPALAVDTHVHRVAARIGLTTDAKTPLETERQLLMYFSKEVIPIAHHWLILHGRYICIARKPKCEECGLTEVCRFYRKSLEV